MGAHGGLDGIQEDVIVHRLLQEFHGAALEGAAAQVDVGVTGQHHDRQIGKLRQPGQHVQPADTRHADVQHHATD
ncbi:hypothetical protein D9M70_579360 [compost metagenome]